MSLKKDLKFSWMEFSGSLGDLGLFIPLVVAVTITSDLDIGMVLVLAGLMNVVTGLIFRLPIPVQPMKALAIIVITEGMIRDELIAAGILIGVILIVCSFFIEKITARIPKAVVWGVQLGVGLKLALKGLGWLMELPLVGFDSISIALFVLAILIFFIYRNKPGLILVFLGGFFLQIFENIQVFESLHFQWPEVYVVIPDFRAFKYGFWEGVLPQLPVTLLNSVVALCALSKAYFPGKSLSPQRITLSVGLMNLLCVPLGGIPMCHGSGGLAAQYRFGARTGGSVIMLGLLKIFVGLAFGVTLFELLQTYPIAVLGPMLVLAGVQLFLAAKPAFNNKFDAFLVVVTALMIVWQSVIIGFLFGCVLIIGRANLLGRKADA